MPYALAIRDALLYYVVVPIWWYSEGLVYQLKSLARAIREIDYLTGFSIWVTHLFVPMYGQHDWQGRLISVLIRSIQIIIRGFVLVVLVFLRILLALFYLLLPIVAVLGALGFL